jgi:transglutaminase-like putative cysteine protease
VEQEFELLPAYGSSTLVALETPVAFLRARVRNGPVGSQVGLVQLTDEQVRLTGSPNSVTYTATSEPASAARVDAADLERFLQLPSGLDPRVGALASRVVGDEQDAARAAERLATYLQRNYSYSLESGASDSKDPLAAFLFEQRKGHCEHFATALAILLRSRGFAARVVTGFYGGERDGDGYLLRAADAHAWVQVHVPGNGFVTYDATPESFRAGHPPPFLDWAARTYDDIERLWRTQVVDYSFVDQARFAQGVFGTRRNGASAGLPKGTGKAVLGLALLLLARAGWRRLARIPRRDETERLGLRLEKILQSAEPPLHAGEDLESYLSRLRHYPRLPGPGVPRVLRRYLEARFGKRPLEYGEAAVLVRHARTALKRKPSSTPDLPRPL